jgi:hypothetical protein
MPVTRGVCHIFQQLEATPWGSLPEGRRQAFRAWITVLYGQKCTTFLRHLIRLTIVSSADYSHQLPMKNVLVVLAIVVFAWFAYSRTNGPSDAPTPKPLRAGFVTEPLPESQFSCDGRTRCSQMTSCEEAMYFLRNCPGVEMDGNGDGEPCETQWCGDSQ